MAHRRKLKDAKKARRNVGHIKSQEMKMVAISDYVDYDRPGQKRNKMESGYNHRIIWRMPDLKNTGNYLSFIGGTRNRKPQITKPLYVVNDGPRISKSNFPDFQMDNFIISLSAGAVRILMPKIMWKMNVNEIKTGEYVVITDLFPSRFVEFMFEDNSNSPFFLNTDPDAFVHGIIPAEWFGTEGRPISIWVDGETVWESTCNIRRVMTSTLPYLNRWEK